MAHNANIITDAAVSAQSVELGERSCWGGFCCFGTKKPKKQIVPAFSSQGSSASSSQVWESQHLLSPTPTQIIGVSPSLPAPPSSPASFRSSTNASSIQSPAHFAVSLPNISTIERSSSGMSFDPKAMMFTIGPYAHETELVTPPAFSDYTTTPSTTPFTPPPELVQCTTPPSPDVPFAHFLTSSMCEKGGAWGAVTSFSSSGLTSPSQPSSTGLGLWELKFEAQRNGTSSLSQHRHLSFPPLYLDTSSAINAAYVASMLISEASPENSSPMANLEGQDKHHFNSGRSSFGFEKASMSLIYWMVSRQLVGSLRKLLSKAHRLDKSYQRKLSQSWLFAK